VTPSTRPGTLPTESDLAKLAERWIDESLAKIAQLRRVDTHTGASLIGRADNHSYEGLAIPYFLPEEHNLVREWRIRRDHPDIEYRNGQPKERGKYLSPPGRGNLIYFVPGIANELLRNSQITLVITEGEFKTLALWRLANHGASSPRFVPIGFNGVNGWTGTIGKTANADGARTDVKGPIPDLNLIIWTKRKVLIAFDADAATNVAVEKAKQRLAWELRSRGARVIPVNWDIKQGKGIDDLLAATGPDHVLELFRTAKPVEKKEIETVPFRTPVEVINRSGGLEAYVVDKHRQGIQSPWAEFNEKTGGLRDGELIILAGSTTSGKTAFAINYSLHAARCGTGVALFSLEMSEVELTDRFLSLAGEIDSRVIKAGADLYLIDKAARKIEDLPLYICDQSYLTLQLLEATVEHLLHQHNIGLVVCDYLQLMSSTRRFSTRAEEVSALSRGLKIIAKNTGLPFLVISQLNRAPGREKRPPELYDLRESGGLEMDSNVVLFLYHKLDPSKPRYSDRPDELTATELLVAKQRSGPSNCTVSMWFQKTCGKFEEKTLRRPLQTPAPV